MFYLNGIYLLLRASGRAEPTYMSEAAYNYIMISLLDSYKLCDSYVAIWLADRPPYLAENRACLKAYTSV